MAHFDVFFLGVVSGVLGTLFVIRLCADWRAFRSCLVDVPDDWLTIDCGDGHITIAQARLTQILLEGKP